MSQQVFTRLTVNPIRRIITEWSLDIEKKRILGNVELFDYNFKLFVHGYIMGTVGEIVIARIQNRVYALILSNVNPCFPKKEKQWLAYLDTLQIPCDIIF